jgi:putative transcriptional regulator
VDTLRHWERGDRSPRGATLVLLNLIDRDPKSELKALDAVPPERGVPAAIQ